MEEYDVIIVGGGIVGTASMYAISRYSNFRKVLMIEKENDVALLNSNSKNNSQTLHSGEIETNYSIEKTAETKEHASLVVKYANRELNSEEKIKTLQKCQKMALAVGSEEIEKLEKRYDSKFKELFPYVKKLKRDELEKVEPNIIKGRNRDEKLLALFTEEGYMVNYNELANSFIKRALEKESYTLKLNEEVKKIGKPGGNFEVETNKKIYRSKLVLVAAGAYSLLFARRMGYAMKLGILSVWGKFFYSKKVLKGKVYRVEREGIPFAAVHGDPDITNDKITRFGPTVNIYPELEKGNWSSIPDYFRSMNIDMDTVKSMENILKDHEISKIVRENAVYSIPVIGKREFTKNEVNKIVPSLKPEDLKLARGIGGVRPQIVDTEKKNLALGGTAIKGDGIIFNVTPSPGATSCLKEAMDNALFLADYSDNEFDIGRFKKELDYRL